MKFFCLKTILLIVIVFINSCRKSEYTVDNKSFVRDNGSGTGTITWTNDKIWILDGFVFVNDGQTLTIEAGTVIKGRTGQAENASALIVARGGRIIAEGTPDAPIIFTVEGDDLKGSVPVKAKGLWGGLIILGNARLNTREGEGNIEGIPLTEPRGIYGGNYDEDNSGILRYVSIRHGGTSISEGNEINGLTLGGVGNQTIIDYVEVIANKDDGFEFFGGSVNCRYLISAFCGDDAFDFDLGYHGKGQFWVAFQEEGDGNSTAEHNGGSIPVTGTPHTKPMIYNATFIGNRETSDHALIKFSRNGAGKYFNSIFINENNGVNIENSAGQIDSYYQWQSENIVFKNNIFYNVEDDVIDSIFQVVNTNGSVNNELQSNIKGYFLEANNEIRNPGIAIGDESYDLIPSSEIHENLHPLTDEWFNDVDYKGAFGTVNWARQWTLLDKEGYFSD